MHPNPHIRQGIKARSEPGLSRMLVVSLIIHALFLLLFSGVILPKMKTPPKPVYVVDLVNLPVKDPRAGRPDVRKGPEKAEPKPAASAPEPKPDAVPLPPKPETKPEVVKPEPPKPEPKTEPKSKPKPKPEPKPEPKPTPKPTPKADAKPKPEKPKPADKPKVTAKDEASVTSALEKLQKKQEYAGVQSKILAMAAAKNAKGSAGDVPVGMPDGKGTEEGVSSDAWLQEYLKQAWRLSKYQVGRADLEAKMQLIFDGQGKLANYTFTKKSSDGRFDDSVVRAVLQLKDYPVPALAGSRKDVVFNLKELQRP
ncbi:TonB C-terminal domain-containing protein [Trichloromonas sp.]|uniref:TonB C-terminal domain-containing protein n=1 Tax=Trichloromonas sp. TaxID=3069249 RepID=UPI002A4BE435|nr:TonB C-terminal domain-containing protein [Trichloromonas sp.]